MITGIRGIKVQQHLYTANHKTTKQELIMAGSQWLKTFPGALNDLGDEPVIKRRR